MATKKAATAATTKTTKKPAARKKVAGSVVPKEKAKRPPGRPTSYTPELGADICKHVAEATPLRDIAAKPGMPATSTMMLWLDGRHPEFSEQYARAREAQADKLAEEILSIADDGLNDTYLDADGNKRTDTDVIARSKLRVDARKWLASKMAPKKYGDKIEATHTGPNGGPIQSRIAIEFVRPVPAKDEE